MPLTTSKVAAWVAASLLPTGQQHPLGGLSASRLPTHSLSDIWVVSCSGLLQKSSYEFMCRFCVNLDFHFSKANTQEWACWVLRSLR